MAEKATIARPYAKAAFEYAKEHNALPRWSEALAIASAVVTARQVARLLNHPRVTPAQLVDLIASVGGERIDASARRFLEIVATNRRLNVLPNIAAMFEVMRAEVENVADVEVTSAVELNDAQKQRLSDALRKRLKRDIRLHCSVDPALIGGAVVRSGDLVIDGSLKARIERLSQVIAQ
jgi:F-type H+-transporting ATPase subunit delta